MKTRALLLLPAFLFCFSVSVAQAEDPLVPVSALTIQAIPDQTTVKAGMMFLVSARVVNSSPDTSSEFWANTCSFEKHWVTDSPGVFIQSWTCDENTLEQVTLEPGDVYQKNIILYIPKKDKTEPVIFRLGFKQMSENGDIAEPLWSDPVTIQVIVPEEMKDETPAADASAKTEEPVPAVPAEAAVGEAPAPTAQPEAPVTVEGTLMFQDPAVPIRVAAGDEFSISLASNPSTGFRWKMTLPEKDQTLAFLGSGYVASPEVMPGAPGAEVFKFKAATPGETKAAFVYIRPWETITAPARKIFTILVQEN
jgi:inhibitor of cysteine peptidase